MNKKLNIINKELLRKLSDYAGLRISENEEEDYIADLNGILEKLEEFANMRIPQEGSMQSSAVLRKDTVKPGFDQDWLRANTECCEGYVCTSRIRDKEK